MERSSGGVYWAQAAPRGVRAKSSLLEKGLIKEVKAFGPYLNFFADWKALTKLIVENALKKNYGKGSKKKEKAI